MLQEAFKGFVAFYKPNSANFRLAHGQIQEVTKLLLDVLTTTRRKLIRPDF